jgi:serine/threonine protein kinase
MTTPCSPELLQSALTGHLPPEREQVLQSHLEECETCTAALEKLAGGAELWQEAAAMFAPDGQDSDLGGHLNWRATGSSRTGDAEWSDIDFSVEHLEPSDEPGVLGRLGGYDVLEIIGRGGMGVVLKGYDPELKRCVAIKVLSPLLAHSSLAKKRFAREAQAAAAVVHPNVLAIHQVQPAGRLPFLVMPLVAGESLAQRLAAQGRLGLTEVLRIAMQAAAALAAAHEQGLVHRDVKPANILLEKGVERAVLTDFGLARAADDVSMTRWGIIAGTPEYMSPEQAHGEAVDGRSDLFSLGCVLYEMASGVSPFKADTTLATLRRLIDDAPPTLAALNPELPPWFIGIVERLLQKDPAKRVASAKEVSELLEGCLAHLQQPANVPLPNVHISLRRDGCITAERDEYDTGQPTSSPLPPGGGQGVRAAARSLTPGKPLLIGTLAMLTLLGISLFAIGVVNSAPPDISGKWQGEDWGQVTLTQTAPGEYTGTYTDTVVKEKGAGKIDLKWSRIERRFNGTWREGDDDRFGTLSVHLVGKEIRGALTTSAKSKINPATPRLAELAWTPVEPAASATAEQSDLVRVTAIPALEPRTWHWKVHLPKGKRFGWMVSYGDILASGFHKQPWGSFSNEPYDETGLDAVLTAALRRQNDGNWAMTLVSQSVSTKESFGGGSVDIPKDALRPLLEAVGQDETYAGRRETETFDPELPVTLLWQTDSQMK